MCMFVGGFLLSGLGGVADKRKCDMCYAGNIEKITTVWMTYGHFMLRNWPNHKTTLMVSEKQTLP